MATPDTPDTPSMAAHGCISAETPLLFMHLPKTGGMSMFTAFTSLWGTDIADLYNVSTRNIELAEQAVRDPSKALYCGHYAFGLHQWMERPVYYAAVMREPVARIVSLYHFCQPMLQHNRQRLQQLGGDLGKLAEQPGIADFYLDFSPWLSGEPTPEAFFASPSAEMDNGMVRRFSGYGLNPAPCPESALAQAKLHIEQYFSVVGLLERYPETLQLMANTFGLPELNAHHVNEGGDSASKTPLSDAIMEKIRAMNSLDLALYDWVSERFENQLAQPCKAVQVAGGARSDYAAMPLWRAVGRSPLRESAMRDKGLRQQPKPSQAVLCNRITGASFNRTAIMTDIDTALIRPDHAPMKGPSTRLVFEPKMAKLMLSALNKSIAAYEKKHGTIEE